MGAQFACLQALFFLSSRDFCVGYTVVKKHIEKVIVQHCSARSLNRTGVFLFLFTVGDKKKS